MRRQRPATRRMPLACPSIAWSVNVGLDGDGDGFTAADAEPGDATLRIPRLQQRRNRGPTANPRRGENSGARGSAKASVALVLPRTDMSEGLVPMIRCPLQRADCGTHRVLIHLRTDGATAPGTRRRKFIASGIPTA
jgi:hypothetical protein